MGKLRKEKSISRIFIKYIISFMLLTILIPICMFFILIIGLDTKVILPANYYEQIVEKNRIQISSADISDLKSLIPEECKYAVFDLNGNPITSNVSEEETLDLWDLILKNNTNKSNYYFKIISRDNEVCIVGYTLQAFFKNSYVRKIFPNIEISLIVLALIAFVLEIAILSRLFGKRLSKEIDILKETTNNISMENLDFSIGNSNIKEINDVLKALSKMKNELSSSMHKVWQIEQQRKSQISSLAHDIKTPITVIKGNAELLNELNLNNEQSLFNERILKETNTIENYTRKLIEIMNSDNDITIKKKYVKTEYFIKELIDISNSLSIKKDIKVIFSIKNIPEYINIDEECIKRSIINIISNAIDYSPCYDNIFIKVKINNDNLEFIIEDNGRGFSQEELKKAANQFFQGDKSRSSKDHYGMGLYIAESLIKNHDGYLMLENSCEHKGAKVIIGLPINCN